MTSFRCRSRRYVAELDDWQERMAARGHVVTLVTTADAEGYQVSIHVTEGAGPVEPIPYAHEFQDEQTDPDIQEPRP